MKTPVWLMVEVNHQFHLNQAPESNRYMEAITLTIKNLSPIYLKK